MTDQERPALPPLSGAPVLAKSWPSEPPPNSPFTGNGLLLLLNDAAQRATDVLTCGQPSGLKTDPIVDLARRAASPMPAALRRYLAASAGLTAASLDLQARAYRLGGAEAVHIVNEPSWTPAASDTDLALGQLVAHFGVEPVVRANSFTVDNDRFTLSQSGRWWRAERKSSRWRIAAGPADTLIELLDPQSFAARANK